MGKKWITFWAFFIFSVKSGGWWSQVEEESSVSSGRGQALWTDLLWAENQQLLLHSCHLPAGLKCVFTSSD